MHAIDGELKTKLAATAIISADSMCNLHYLVIISGYGASSSAHRMITGQLALEGVYARATSGRKEITLSGFNENYIVSCYVDHILHVLRAFCRLVVLGWLRMIKTVAWL